MYNSMSHSKLEMTCPIEETKETLLRCSVRVQNMSERPNKSKQNEHKQLNGIVGDQEDNIIWEHSNRMGPHLASYKIIKEERKIIIRLKPVDERAATATCVVANDHAMSLDRRNCEQATCVVANDHAMSLDKRNCEHFSARICSKVMPRKARYQSRMMTKPYTPFQHVRKMKDCSSLMNNLTLSDEPSSTSTSTSPLQQCQKKDCSSLMNNLTLSDGPSSTNTSSSPLQQFQLTLPKSASELRDFALMLLAALKSN